MTIFEATKQIQKEQGCTRGEALRWAYQCQREAKKPAILRANFDVTSIRRELVAWVRNHTVLSWDRIDTLSTGELRSIRKALKPITRAA